MTCIPWEGNSYHWVLETTTGQPTGGIGITITPGNNSKGTYVEYVDGSLVVNDVWFIMINFNTASSTGVARDTIVDIGIDESAGTSYSIVIPDLIASNAGASTGTGLGIWYGFPLFIKSGSSIAARASQNNATPTTIRSWLRLFGKPARPELTAVGSDVVAYGIAAGTSNGAAITQGTTSEGAYGTIGTTTKDHWYWQFGYGTNDATMQGGAIVCDVAVGDATNKRLIVENDYIFMTNSETAGSGFRPYYARVKSGDIVYGRAQASGVVDSNVTMSAYGVT